MGFSDSDSDKQEILFLYETQISFPYSKNLSLDHMLSKRNQIHILLFLFFETRFNFIFLGLPSTFITFSYINKILHALLSHLPDSYHMPKTLFFLSLITMILFFESAHYGTSNVSLSSLWLLKHYKCWYNYLFTTFPTTYFSYHRVDMQFYKKEELR
jgi:hypothetical protein